MFLEIPIKDKEGFYPFLSHSSTHTAYMRVVSLLKTPFKFPASLRERERERERGAAALCPFHVFYKQLYSDEEVQDKD
jgi:hypothetical protein